MLGTRLINLRKNRKLTQKELAVIIGIARTTYSGYENESREPDYETLQKIASFFNVSIDFLLGRVDKPQVVLTDVERELYDNIDLPNDILKKYFRIPKEMSGMSNEEKDMTMDLIIQFLRARKEARK